MKYLILAWLILSFLMKTIAILIFWNLVLSKIFKIEPITPLMAMLIILAWILFTLKIETKNRD